MTCVERTSAVSVISYFHFVSLKDSAGNKEIGLLLRGCSRCPSFGIGFTSACFQPLGKTPLARESLMMRVIGDKISGRPSLINRAEILSAPGALFDDTETMI